MINVKGSYKTKIGLRAIITRLKSIGGQWMWVGGIEDTTKDTIMIPCFWFPYGDSCSGVKGANIVGPWDWGKDSKNAHGNKKQPLPLLP